MKKTLIALIALTGVAAAETVIFDLNKTAGTSYGTYAGVSIVQSGDWTDGVVSKTSKLNGKSITLQFDNGTGVTREITTTEADNWSNTLGMPSGVSLGITTADMGTILSSSAEIEGGHTNSGSFPGISHFTITGLGAGHYELVSFMGRSGGSTTNTALTLSGVSASTVTSYIYSGGSWSSADAATLGYSATNSAAAMMNIFSFEVTDSSTPIVLTYNGSVTYQDGKTPGDGTDITTYQNVQFLAIKSIPEPATATLSLLALCGLAARRRRK